MRTFLHRHQKYQTTAAAAAGPIRADSETAMATQPERENPLCSTTLA